jgi:hypothetical protein
MDRGYRVAHSEGGKRLAVRREEAIGGDQECACQQLGQGCEHGIATA